MTLALNPFSVMRLPREILFGEGQLRAIGSVAARLGLKAPICADTRLASGDAFAELQRSLQGAGLRCQVFDATEPDLPSENLYCCAEAARSFSPDLVIGVGGGSCLDMAKCTALILTHGGRLEDYYGEFNTPRGSSPSLRCRPQPARNPKSRRLLSSRIRTGPIPGLPLALCSVSADATASALCICPAPTAIHAAFNLSSKSRSSAGSMRTT